MKGLSHDSRRGGRDAKRVNCEEKLKALLFWSNCWMYILYIGWKVTECLQIFGGKSFGGKFSSKDEDEEEKGNRTLGRWVCGWEADKSGSGFCPLECLGFTCRFCSLGLTEQ